jgi:hypothetical protein
MDTDLRETQGTSIEPEASRLPPTCLDPRWPYVATAIVLAVLAAVTVLVLTQGAPRPSASPEQWQRNVEGMMTNIREGSGYAPVEDAPHTQPSRVYANYLKGALTESREGS